MHNLVNNCLLVGVDFKMENEILLHDFWKKKKKKKNAVQAHKKLSNVYDEKAFKVQRYQNWFAKYHWLRISNCSWNCLLSKKLRTLSNAESWGCQRNMAKDYPTKWSIYHNKVLVSKNFHLRTKRTQLLFGQSNFHMWYLLLNYTGWTCKKVINTEHSATGDIRSRILAFFSFLPPNAARAARRCCWTRGRERNIAIEFQLTVAIDRGNEWPAGRVTAARKIRSILPLLG